MNRLNNFIDTEFFSKKIRRRIVRLDEKKVLVAFLNNTIESKDKYTRINCNGYGRIRIYRNYALHLPTKFKKALNKAKPLLRGHPPSEKLTTQVFQLAGCNWRCWYCFVDFNLLSGDSSKGKFFSADELLDLYLNEEKPANIIDLSGGQPDLVPEWTLWMMKSLESRELAGKLYVWVDDNLSNRYLWRYLTNKQINFVANFPLSSRVGCFKGFDELSFSFNTKCSPDGFEQQFEIFKELLNAGFNMYAYTTFTTPNLLRIEEKISRFVDKLQCIHPMLPLRTIPLKISPFSATRLSGVNKKAIDLQIKVMDYWSDELEKRFNVEELNSSISEIKLK